eukprot:CAMPEP_0185017998 /NCGR_PEP_ID=MMETSP1103-20130426/842_1 /TAXON_ID=36769 /ORGANISM="Paraphysomonas bandaiensis, Strain Caron Lab Isolate" /LENGTH=1593 /DNA_ID=CAMNT_0027547641 /DNA_START=63 /DNA_END=4844 /DNA_ORIENTATION=-
MYVYVGLLLLVHTSPLSSAADHSQISQVSHKSAVLDSVPYGLYNGSIKVSAPVSYQLGDEFFGYGMAMTNAWSMLVEWVNYDRGGIHLNGLNYSLKIQYVEDFSDPSHVSQLCQSFAAEEEVQFIFGPFSSSLTSACVNATEDKEKIILSGGSSDTDMYREYELLYGTLPGDASYMSTAFCALKNFGAESVAVIRDTEYTSCMNSTALLNADDCGINISGVYDVDPQSPFYEQNVTAILEELKSQGIQSIYGCSYGPLCIEIPEVSESIDYNPSAVFFTNCLSSSDVLSILGDSASYLFALTPWAPTDDIRGTFTGWTAQDFSDRYSAIYNTVPPYQAASTFAAGIVLVDAIETTQSLQEEILLQYLQSKRQYETFYANFSFDSHHQAMFDVLLSQVQPINTNGTTEQDVVLVLPAAVSDAPPIYPAPTWSQRACNRDTNYCSSHGQCDTSGECICDNNYYGAANPSSCDTYCDGQIVDGACRSSMVYYIGGMVAYQYSEASEYKSSMRLAVDLINNKTDGWFDNDTAQVTLVLQLNNSACSANTAYLALQNQNQWAQGITGRNLDGLIGAECSSGSKTTASYGNSLYLPQISFKSTSTELSDKDAYQYFARTCASDAAQGPAVASLLMKIGVSPYIVVVSTDDDYAEGLSSSFATSYENAGNIILDSIIYTSGDPSVDYDGIIDRIAQTGTPAILLVMYQDEVSNIFNAASTHPILGTDAVIWIGVDSWIDVELSDTIIPNGIIGLSPFEANNSQTIKYRSLWESLDPNEYIDTDGDRSTFAAYSLHIVDAVVALALAYQKTINDNTGLTGTLLQQYTYTALTRDISFEGVSGDIDFDSQGDLVNPQYRIVNYDTVNKWVDKGTAKSASSELSMPFTWPDGTYAYIYHRYGDQLLPYCPAGQEPVLGSSGTYVCKLCNVGFYNPEANMAYCKECPSGADCNDVGIAIPCVLAGYWRDQPPTDDELSNFDKYKIYSCDTADNCKGGCMLNASCADHTLQSSPTCAVCKEGYYLDDGSCLKCTSFEESNSTALNVLRVVSITIFTALLGAVLWFSVSFSMLSFQKKTALQSYDKSRSHAVERQSSIPRVLRDLLAEKKNIKAGKKVIKGTAMTGKLVVSFIQVVSGSFYTINADWPKTSHNMFKILNVNPLNSLQATYNCSKNNTSDPYLVGLVIFFMAPIVFLSLLVLVACVVYILANNRFAQPTNEDSHTEDSKLSGEELIELKRSRVGWSIWNTSAKIFLWFCLIAYPSLSSSMLVVYNCRDLGVTGVFLRDDYSIECGSHVHSSSVAVGTLGTILYVIGIPLLFYLTVRYRQHPMLENPSSLLHENFAREWVYYECYDLIRKLLLTSVMPYVAPPDSASQCLYLLLVDMMALIILAYSRPYANKNDDLLSTVFISVECALFLMALVVVSGISDDDNYNALALYNTMLVLVVVSLACVVPWTFAMKFSYFRNKVNAVASRAAEKASKLGIIFPDFHRLDAKTRLDEDIEVVIRQSMADRNSFFASSMDEESPSGVEDSESSQHIPFVNKCSAGLSMVNMNSGDHTESKEVQNPISKWSESHQSGCISESNDGSSPMGHTEDVLTAPSNHFS